MRFLVHIAAVSALACLLGQAANADTINFSLKGSNVQTLKRVSFTDAKFKTWYTNWTRVDDAYAALLYVRSADDTDGVLTAVHAHNLKDLDQLAKVACQFFANANTGSTCQTIARKVPKATSQKSGGVSLSRTATVAFQERYLPKIKPGKYGAFAIRQNGGYGFGFNQSTEGGAKRRAMRECKKRTKIKGEMELFQAAKIVIAQKYRLDKCRIVHVQRPRKDRVGKD